MGMTIDEINEQIKKLEEKKTELENAEKEKLIKEKEARRKELEDAYDRYQELLDKYCDDYKAYYSRKENTNDNALSSLLEIFGIF